MASEVNAGMHPWLHGTSDWVNAAVYLFQSAQVLDAGPCLLQRSSQMTVDMA
jgi:hypothetical protein